MINVSFIEKKNIRGGGYIAYCLFNYNEFWTWPMSNVGFEGAELFNSFKWLAKCINLVF